MMQLINAIQGIWETSALPAAVWGMCTCFAVCVLLVLTQKWHGAFTMDHVDGVQKFHSDPTPRIGGVAIFAGLLVACYLAPSDVQSLMKPLLLAGLPAFVFGLAEDMTKRVGVMQRLLATMGSGLLAWWLTDYSLTRVDIWGVDWFLSFAIVSVVFTAFAVGGVANSINIIDGFNGLASATAVLAFAGLAMIAWQVNDFSIATLALLLGASVFGFFCVNWPFGKIFLGDGGSYFIGFALAWLAVLLIERNPGVSAFAALVICVHPVTEVLFSMYRRKIKKTHLGHPDRLHFHSLVNRRYVARWFSSVSNPLRNSITGLLVSALSLLAVLVANVVFDDVLSSVTAFVALAFAYLAIYVRMLRHRW